MLRTGPVVDDIGLQAFVADAGSMVAAHVHPELEFNLLLAGEAYYETAGGGWRLPARRLVVFWGGYPHRLVADSALEMLGVSLPLSATGHPVLATTVSALLAGRVLVGDPAEAALDEFVLRRWAADLSNRASRTTELCVLEMQARIARLDDACAGERMAPVQRSRVADRLLAVVARRYTEPVSVAEVAREAGVHPTYAAKVFSETFDMPIWQYVERLRVAHAQRLLQVTTWPVDEIGHHCGYRTRSSFYRAYRRVVGQSPSAARHREPA